jgi:shikimate dehydrogenase
MEINKDTELCLSISARPSNFGTRFHNALYEELGLNFVYKACAVEDIEGAVRGIRALKIRGSAISMPHKENVMRFLDEIEPAAHAIGAVNTIVNTNGNLKGYNTDVVAVREILSRVPTNFRTALFGSGGMAKAIANALDARGFDNVTIVARNESVGLALASRYNFKFEKSQRPTQIPLPTRSPACTPLYPSSDKFDFLINATPIGMTPDTEHMPCSREALNHAKVIFDSVASPSETLFIRTGREFGKTVITGFEVVVLQAIEQFRLYTGQTPPADFAEKAALAARL